MSTAIYLKREIINKLPGEPTKDQKTAIEELAKFVVSTDNESVFLLKGYAGTGKTTVLAALIKVLLKHEISVELLAPTGRAAKIMTQMSGYKATTIHRRIYRARDPKKPFTDFVLNREPARDTIFIVDEASMLGNKTEGRSIFGSGMLLDDLMEYVYQISKRSKLIFSGDIAQLPPISMGFSPAMDIAYMQKYGLNIVEVQMKEILRQTKDSGILYNATVLRNFIDNQQVDIPKFSINYPDFEAIMGEDLIEKITESYAENGIDQTLVITYSNKRANLYNEGIRKYIFQKEEKITTEENLMIVKNNYFWSQMYNLPFIANGDVAIISQIIDYQDFYDLSFADVELYFPDYDFFIETKILLDSLSINQAAMPYEVMHQLYKKLEEEYSDITDKRKRMEKIRNNKFFNALQVKYAYAITCHKAQGGQWRTVFIDQGFFNPNAISLEYLRWLYTAITRATDKVYLVNFHKSFFQ